MEYAQTVGGIKVFEGQVQVVVNKNGEILSVREGFLVSDPQVRLKSAMTEAQALRSCGEEYREYQNRTERASRRQKADRAADDDNAATGVK